MIPKSGNRFSDKIMRKVKEKSRAPTHTLGGLPMKRFSLFLLTALCLAFGIATASAQEKYPNRPVKVIVPYAPGGATDIVARIVGDAFQKLTGQPFVVLNKPGAFGLLAIDEMAKSTPDGYTLMLGNVSTNAITPILYCL